MAGYVVNLDGEESLRACIHSGIYSTVMSEPSGHWLTHHEATFGDYLLMRPGDHIYFFIKRCIYGIGRLVPVGCDCKYKNYLESSMPRRTEYQDMRVPPIIGDVGTAANMRWICVFEPAPAFFNRGVDMDDVLASNPSAFRMLRAFWRRSFIRVDEQEDKALMDIILKRNEDALLNLVEVQENHDATSIRLNELLINEHRLRSSDILEHCADGSKISHEMAIEVGILEAIQSGGSVFGEWDYVSHQVIASPFKPIDYMDKMDIFGYRAIHGFPTTISKYLIIEIKKEEADRNTIDQIMEYVDWIKQEYAYGDYSMIEAFAIAYDFPEPVIHYRDHVGVRNYTKGRRPTIPGTWSNIRLIRYRYDEGLKQLRFCEIGQRE